MLRYAEVEADCLASPSRGTSCDPSPALCPCPCPLAGAPCQGAAGRAPTRRWGAGQAGACCCSRGEGFWLLLLLSSDTLGPKTGGGWWLGCAGGAECLTRNPLVLDCGSRADFCLDCLERTGLLPVCEGAG